MKNQTETLQKVKFMDEINFMMCASKLKCDTGGDLDCVGLIGIQDAFLISFYGEAKNDYALNIESFGKQNKNFFQELKATPKQISIMKNQLLKQVEKIKNNIEEKYIENQENEAACAAELKYGISGALYSKYY